MADLPTGIVTFVFTDIEGSTRLLQELGADYGAVQDAHMRIMREAISAGGGLELRTEGDAFFAVFRNPRDAVRATVAAQRGLEEHDWAHGSPIRVRMGMHTGEGRLGGDDYLGIDVNRAARIAASGHGGQVLLSDATRVLVERDLPDGVTLRDLEEHRLKDLARPERIFQLDIAGLRTEFPALKSMDARPNNLPPQLTSFVGREREIDQVLDLLRDGRLVTMTGPGGTGKTRLSLEVAARALEDLPGGAFFVDLSPITDPGLVASAIAKALAVAEDPGRPFIESLQDHLRERELLLVLDNFEQVSDAGSEVDVLVRAAPKLRVLVTSRAVLQLYGEREFPVPPLPLPDPSSLPDAAGLSEYEAVALFIDRATSVKPDFRVTNENAPAVAEICTRLDGLPLAIELAASRVKLLAPQAILSRLGKRLELLRSEARNVPERQRTLRGAIDWSCRLLDDPERRLFARLAAFSGGASFEATDAVCNPGRKLGIDTLDGLASLVDKSLVRQTEVGDGESRFSMLETIREFATERLDESGEVAAIRRRHAEEFAAFAERAEPHLLTAEQVRWLDACEREHDNVRAALDWCVDAGEPDIGLRLGSAVWRFWQQRGYLREGRRRLEQILALPGAGLRERLRGYTALGGITYWQSDLDATEPLYEKALGLARELGDPPLVAEALYNLAFVPVMTGDPEDAKPLFEESLEIAREIGDPVRVAQIAGNLGYIHLMKGEPLEALPYLEEQERMSRDRGNLFELADALVLIGNVHRLTGDQARAMRLYREGLDLLVDAANLPMIAAALRALASSESALGRHERALRLWGAGEALEERISGGAPGAGLLLADVVGDATTALGPRRTEAALAEGRAMDEDKAVAYVREEET